MRSFDTSPPTCGIPRDATANLDIHNDYPCLHVADLGVMGTSCWSLALRRLAAETGNTTPMVPYQRRGLTSACPWASMTEVDRWANE